MTIRLVVREGTSSKSWEATLVVHRDGRKQPHIAAFADALRTELERRRL